MATVKLNIFCIPQELVEWIALLTIRYQLEVAWFSLEDEYAKKFESSMSEIPLNCFQIYLLPKAFIGAKRMKFSSINRYSGGIQITPGHFVEKNNRNILLMTEISSSDSDNKDIYLSKAVGWLKRKIKSEEFSGVIGRNVVTGGESEYKNILFTHKAKDLLASSVIWKQATSFNSEFTPKLE